MDNFARAIFYAALSIGNRVCLHEKHFKIKMGT